jgi:hypothetical protein
MNNQKLNKISLSNLIIAYLMSFLFALLIFLILPPKDLETEVVFNVSDSNKTQTERIIKYIDRNGTLVLNHDVPIYYDRLEGVIVDDEESFLETPVNEYPITHIRPTSSRIHTANHESETFRNDIMEHGLNDHGYNSLRGRRNKLPLDNGRGYKTPKLDGHNTISFEEAIALRKIKKENSIGLDGDSSSKHGLDLSKLVPISKDGELSEDLTTLDPDGITLGDSDGGGELYAYSYPSKGVGAGIGNGGLGASIGQAAGISAGIGEGILNGEVVPTLGGIGDGAKTIFGEPAEASGVGGLIGGAGAGGAAGLTQGYIIKKLDLGKGYSTGSTGKSIRNYNHLPENSSLHIMIHVDGSGSILSTRKQLDVMKNTLLKDALLPYYNNNESLYNNRVSIIDDSGERTLRFFSKASEKNNVLAVAFQDEAQPSYHLPNFNKSPEDHYLDDLSALKNKLNNHKGIYRGVLFQVDRGKTFAKSFKEFVGNAFQGKGYLKNKNLKEYYWEYNINSIKQKNGIVFSDEYHAQDKGDPEYYLNLLFNASKKVGLDLNIYGAGLKDGTAENR